MSPTRRPARCLIAAATALTLASPLAATWSIILVDTRTKEVAVASATCIPNNDLRVLTPVIVVGKGGATAQSFVDATGRNRLLIFDEFKKGTAPARILQLLAAQDSGHQTRQYGIVDTSGLAETFSGTGAGGYAGGATGTVGTIAYAVQGNVITGAPVVTKAVEAIRNTPGDLAEKLMAAMEAAYLMGGDGRCSCGANPTGCGSPPPSFTKTAHIGYMLIAREGDTDGVCNTSVGCGSGTYFLELNIRGRDSSGSSPDPVRQLRLKFDYWRIGLRGVPDHNVSRAVLATNGLPADGRTQSEVTVRLRDWEGTPVTSAAQLVVTADAASAKLVKVGQVVAKGGGVYSFPVTSAGTTAGTATLRIRADVGGSSVLLAPGLEIEVRDDPLWASRASVEAAQGGDADFVLRRGAAGAGQIYALLASNSGTSPGIKLGGNLVLPLNPDAFFQAFVELANRPPLTQRTIGNFDTQGWASAAFGIPAGALNPLKGTKLHFAFTTLNPIDFTSNPVELEIK